MATAEDGVRAFVVTRALVPTPSERGLGAGDEELGGLGSIFPLSFERESHHWVGVRATVPGKITGLLSVPSVKLI